MELDEPAIYAYIRRCKKCPSNMVKHGRIWLVNGDGSVLFVGIQPNWNGHPENPKRKSTDHSFNDFNELRKEYGLDKYRFTNLVKCATPKPSEPPTYLEVNNCLPWLEREIKEFGTKLVVFVGKGSYDLYHDYVGRASHVKSTWCYHYSGKVKAMKGYEQKQRDRMGCISGKVR